MVQTEESYQYRVVIDVEHRTRVAPAPDLFLHNKLGSYPIAGRGEKAVRGGFWHSRNGDKAVSGGADL